MESSMCHFLWFVWGKPGMVTAPWQCMWFANFLFASVSPQWLHCFLSSPSVTHMRHGQKLIFFQDPKSKLWSVLLWHGTNKKNPASDIGNRPVDIAGKKRVGWIESSIEIYKPPCVKEITSEKLLYKTGSLTWCSVTIWRGGMGLKMGERFKRRGHTYTYGWLTSMYSRKQHNIVKQLSSN